MKKASVTETKNQLSAILDHVKEGETYLILDRGRPVARLEPVRPGELRDDGERTAALERRGLMRRGRGSIRKEIVDAAPLPLPTKLSAVRILLAERRKGR